MEAQGLTPVPVGVAATGAGTIAALQLKLWAAILPLALLLGWLADLHPGIGLGVPLLFFALNTYRRLIRDIAGIRGRILLETAIKWSGATGLLGLACFATIGLIPFLAGTIIAAATPLVLARR